MTRIDSQVRWSGQSERVERGSASGVRSSCQVSNQRRTTGHSQHWEDTAPTFGTLQVLTGYSSSIRDSTGIARILQLQHSGPYRYWQDTAASCARLLYDTNSQISLWNIEFKLAQGFRKFDCYPKSGARLCLFWRLFCEIKNDIFEIFIIKSSFWFFEI